MLQGPQLWPVQDDYVTIKPLSTSTAGFVSNTAAADRLAAKLWAREREVYDAEEGSRHKANLKACCELFKEKMRQLLAQNGGHLEGMSACRVSVLNWLHAACLWSPARLASGSSRICRCSGVVQPGLFAVAGGGGRACVSFCWAAGLQLYNVGQPNLHDALFSSATRSCGRP